MEEKKYHSILIIDDNIGDLKLMEEHLNQQGFQNIVLSLRGFEGIEMARTIKPDLAIIDINLPDLNGLVVCRVIKEELKEYPPKIISVTGLKNLNHMDEVIVEEKLVGPDCFAVKTTTYDSILKLTKNILNNKGSSRRVFNEN